MSGLVLAGIGGLFIAAGLAGVVWWAIPAAPPPFRAMWEQLTGTAPPTPAPNRDSGRARWWQRLWTAAGRVPASAIGVTEQTRRDLALLDLTVDHHVATRVLGAAVGFVAPPVLSGIAASSGLVETGILIPTALTLICTGVGFWWPHKAVQRRAEIERQDYRQSVWAYLDLVSLATHGGAVPMAAVVHAARVGHSRAFIHIRERLAAARLTGQTWWRALGQLGRDVGVSELTDIAGIVATAGDDGAQIATTLREQSRSMRDRHLAAEKERANGKSAGMPVAIAVIAAAFVTAFAGPWLITFLSS